MKKELLVVEGGQRLDKAISLVRPNYSRASIEKLIQDGSITVNNAVVKTKYIVKEGDVIEASFSQLNKKPDSIELPIIYEDEDVVVINKPVGVLAHSKGNFNKEGTVASWLHEHVAPQSDVILSKVEGSSNKENAELSADNQDNAENSFWSSNRAGIVHRLDRATSGVMILAKNEDAQKHLQKQFAKRNVKKTYLAVTSGELPEQDGLIDVPIERNPKKPATFRPGANGKPAQTHFEVLHVTNDGQHDHSFIELKPYTGRTHQLRVHLQYLNTPIVGDELYGKEPAERLFLHAKELEVTLPGSKRETFEAPVPEEFKKYTV